MPPKKDVKKDEKTDDWVESVAVSQKKSGAEIRETAVNNASNATALHFLSPPCSLAPGVYGAILKGGFGGPSLRRVAISLQKCSNCPMEMALPN